MVRYGGKGWHSQTVRHSNAKKYGKAGGTYSNWRYPKDVYVSKSSNQFKKESDEHPEFSNKQIKRIVIDHNKDKTQKNKENYMI